MKNLRLVTSAVICAVFTSGVITAPASAEEYDIPEYFGDVPSISEYDEEQFTDFNEQSHIAENYEYIMNDIENTDIMYQNPNIMDIPSDFSETYAVENPDINLTFPDEDMAVRAYVNTSTSLLIDPFYGADEIIPINQNDKVMIYEYKGDWVWCSKDYCYGFIPASYIVDSPAASTVSATTSTEISHAETHTTTVTTEISTETDINFHTTEITTAAVIAPTTVTTTAANISTTSSKRFFIWPVPASCGISSCFDDDGRQHGAIDITGSIGDTIIAAADGMVVSSYSGCPHVSELCACNGGAGNYLVIEHRINSRTYYTVYMHCQTLNVSVGSFVKQGQPIASLGSSGKSNGAHLDYSIRVDSFNGNRLDPGYYTNLPQSLYHSGYSFSCCVPYINSILSAYNSEQ